MGYIPPPPAPPPCRVIHYGLTGHVGDEVSFRRWEERATRRNALVGYYLMVALVLTAAALVAVLVVG